MPAEMHDRTETEQIRLQGFAKQEAGSKETIGGKEEKGMNKKQKKMLLRIIIAAVWMVLLHFAYSVLGEEQRTAEGELVRAALIREPVWFILYMIPYLVVGFDILRKAFKGILNRQVFDENFLMVVATIGAIAVALVSGNGDYTEAIAVMLFYQIGELFQSYAVGKSRKNISDLMDIRPDYANIEQDGELVQVDPDEVEVESIIVVQPGEKIPIDGIVTEGDSTLNTGALTGESVPREAHPGDEVISGCINMTGVLRIRTTKEFGESTVSKILDLVENSTSKKSQSENFISKFARYYTPAVCIGALALALLPPILLRLLSGAGAFSAQQQAEFLAAGTMRWGTWIYRALTFLVISCPCALVISIPLSFFAGIGGASREGILVKGSNYLEALSKTKIVAFDKTGTMTKGVFEVSGIHHGRLENEKLLEYAAHAECFSTHPISRSIQKAYEKGILWKIDENTGEAVPVRIGEKCGQTGMTVGGSHAFRAGNHGSSAEAEGTGTGSETGENATHENVCTTTDAIGSSGEDAPKHMRPHTGHRIDRERVKSVEEIGGNGIIATIDDKEVLIGNAKLMQRYGVDYKECPHDHGTVVHMAIDRSYVGHLLISDVIKPTSREAIRSLHEAGVTRTVMLTGDAKKVGEAVAEEIGIGEVHAELLPADKVSAVEELLASRKEKEMVAFVGDGINDAPVLGRADIGIAMGALGSDAAIEAADIVLMDDDPLKIAKAIRISRKCMRIVYENIYFAIGIKLLCLGLGAVGIANMWLAIFADVGVMVLAVLNAIRALWTKKL